jgi:SAM-dependent methyltransferase
MPKTTGVEAGADDRCPLCGAAATTWYSQPRRIRRCSGCGVLHARPSAPAGEEYGERYYTGGVYADYLADQPVVRRSAAIRLRRLEVLTAGRTLLDAGCAAGFFIEEALARGWDAVGLDVSGFASASARQRGLPVITGSIEDPPALDRRFDAVTMWDTIEHLDQPCHALAAARRLLHDGGVFALTTGDASSLFARLTGRRWRLYQDPTHRFFFDEGILTALLKGAGFETIDVAREGKWVSTAMILHQSNLRPAVAIARRLSRTAVNPAVYVNLRDVMTIVARAV